jgi:hypothetical protein
LDNQQYPVGYNRNAQCGASDAIVMQFLMRMTLFLGRGVTQILKVKKNNIIHRLKSNIRYWLALRYINAHTTNVRIDGNDNIGYRFIITERRPIVIHGHVIRRGRDRFTGYADVTKEELYQIFTDAYNDVVLQIALDDGCISQIINIPTKYIDKLKKQLELLP